MKKLFLPSIIGSLFLTGCSTVAMNDNAKATVNTAIKSAKDEVLAPRKIELKTEVVNQRYLKATITEYTPGTRGEVSQSLANVSVYSAFQAVAEQGGYSTIVTSDVDTNTKITIDLRNLSTVEALKEIAGAAGYVAVIDKQRKTATISKWATYTFRVPNGVFKLPDTVMSMSASPSKAGGGKSGGGSAGGVDSSFSAKLDRKSDPDGFKKMIIEIAGEGASVTVLPDTGLISVRAQAQQLKRVSAFLRDHVKNALMQVELETSIIEVTLDDAQDHGVDWSRIFTPTGDTLSFGLKTADLVAGSVTQVGYSTQNITSVLKMVAQTTNYKILDQDSRPYQNNVPLVFFRGTEKPYIPEVQQTTTTGTSTSTSTSASLEMAQDGIAFSVLPNILDTQNVELSIQPMINRLGAPEQFPVGSNTLTGFATNKNLSNSKLVVSSGKTYMVSRTTGSRTETTDTGIPGVNKTTFNNIAGYSKDKVVRYETVILVHPRIIPAPKVDILVGESI